MSATRQRNLSFGCLYGFLVVGLLFGVPGSFCTCLSAQETLPQDPGESVDEQQAAIEAPESVAVEALATDDAIAERLRSILEATGWFENVEIQVDDGVVFLEGQTEQTRFREWGERLATKTQDVVAVVNRIRVREKSIWDLSSAWETLHGLGRDAVRLLPFLALGAGVLIAFWYLAHPIAAVARRLVPRRVESKLLRDVSGTAATILVLVIGMYVALRASGLTQLALTILGGTGLVGLAIGFAFRDIAENYLASILISLNRPFRLGDLVEIDGREGFVQRVTTRGTLLMTLGGDHVHLPNSLVYKSVVVNFTANKNSQAAFVVGIGYDDDIQSAQRLITDVLTNHPAVLSEPAAATLVISLGTSTVNLKAMFWLDVRKHSKPKVASAVMRQVKQTLVDAGVSMPDEAREVIFPQGVPVSMLERPSEVATVESGKMESPRREELRTSPQSEPAATDAEGGLESEAKVIEDQARHSNVVDGSEDLVSSQE